MKDPHVSRCRAVAYGSAEYAQAVALREQVLRAPLGLRFGDVELAEDAGREHLGFFDRAMLIGCVSLYLETAATLRIKQMAVAPEYQGHGIGVQLMQAAEARGVVLGARVARLHARVSAQPFYAKLGYAVTSEVFEEKTVPHVVMARLLG